MREDAVGDSTAVAEYNISANVLDTIRTQKTVRMVENIIDKNRQKVN